MLPRENVLKTGYCLTKQFIQNIFSGDLLSSIFYPSVIKDLQIQFNSETVTIFLMLPENQKVLYHKCASVECTLPPDNCPLYFNVSTKE